MRTDLREYFDFLQTPVEVIRLKGTRINLDMIVQLVHEGMVPEQIADYFAGPVPLDHIYAAVTFYLMNKQEIDDYIRRGDERAERLRSEYEAAHPESAELRNRIVRLKKQFTGPDGKIDFAALKAHVDAERKEAKDLVGAG
jgi:uncharacterized protein (DUF433 family)